MKIHHLLILTFVFSFSMSTAQAKDRLKLDITVIKGNKEMPQIVYIIPWKDVQKNHEKEQTLVLHSLFGDLFDPILMVNDSVDRGMQEPKSPLK